MAETPKKRTTTKTASADKPATTAKPRKTAAKKSANGVSAEPIVINGHAAAHERAVPHDEVAKLAHTYWQERGGKHGYHVEDWFRAEQELRGKAS